MQFSPSIVPTPSCAADHTVSTGAPMHRQQSPVSPSSAAAPAPSLSYAPVSTDYIHDVFKDYEMPSPRHKKCTSDRLAQRSPPSPIVTGPRQSLRKAVPTLALAEACQEETQANGPLSCDSAITQREPFFSRTESGSLLQSPKNTTQEYYNWLRAQSPRPGSWSTEEDHQASTVQASAKSCDSSGRIPICRAPICNQSECPADDGHVDTDTLDPLPAYETNNNNILDIASHSGFAFYHGEEGSTTEDDSHDGALSARTIRQRLDNRELKRVTFSPWVEAVSSTQPSVASARNENTVSSSRLVASPAIPKKRTFDHQDTMDTEQMPELQSHRSITPNELASGAYRPRLALQIPSFGQAMNLEQPQGDTRSQTKDNAPLLRSTRSRQEARDRASKRQCMPSSPAQRSHVMRLRSQVTRSTPSRSSKRRSGDWLVDGVCNVTLQDDGKVVFKIVWTATDAVEDEVRDPRVKDLLESEVKRLYGIEAARALRSRFA